ALQLGSERVPVTVVAAEPGDAPSSVEEEYLFVLFTHLLNTGTFTAAEVDWVSAQLRGGGHGLVLQATTPLSGGFCVDIAGKMGLVRCSGTDRGATFRYLDSASVV